MSLEAAIEKLTAAVEANTAALAAGGAAPAAAPAATTTTKGGKGGKTTTTEPSVTRDQMVKALNDLKEKSGVAAAKKVVKEVGKAEKMADIADDKIEAVFKEATKALSAEEDGGDI